MPNINPLEPERKENINIHDKAKKHFEYFLCLIKNIVYLLDELN